MKFNREKFIEETSGNIGAALDVIEEILQMINGYCKDDEFATGHGQGVYGSAYDAEKQLLSTVEDKFSSEFIDSTFDS